MGLSRSLDVPDYFEQQLALAETPGTRDLAIFVDDDDDDNATDYFTLLRMRTSG